MAQLANSEVKEGVAHLFREFLSKGRDVDFICEKVSPQLIEEQCSLFVSSKAKDNMLTRTQFFSVERILKKTKRIDKLADIVISVILGKINLVEQTSNDGALDFAADEIDFVPCRLTCEERLKLTSDILQLMRFYQNSRQPDRSAPSMMVSDNQVTGAIGGQIEKR